MIFSLLSLLVAVQVNAQQQVSAVFPAASCAGNPTWILFEKSEKTCVPSECSGVLSISSFEKCSSAATAEEFLSSSYPNVGYLLTSSYADATCTTPIASYAIIANGECAAVGILGATSQKITFNADGSVSYVTYKDGTCTGEPVSSATSLLTSQLNVCTAGFKFSKVGASGGSTQTPPPSGTNPGTNPAKTTGATANTAEQKVVGLVFFILGALALTA